MVDQFANMIHPPKLLAGEEFVDSIEANRKENPGGKEVIAVTTKRLLFRGKKGVPELFNQSGPVDIALEDIRAVRTKGNLGVLTVTIETYEDIFTLPHLQKSKAEELVNAIVETAELVESEWGEEGQSGTEKKARGGLAATLGALGIIGTVLVALLGFTFIIMGILLSLTIIGAIIGVPLIWLGLLITSAATGIGAAGLGSGMFVGGSISDGQQEWVPLTESKK